MTTIKSSHRTTSQSAQEIFETPDLLYLSLGFAPLPDMEYPHNHPLNFGYVSISNPLYRWPVLYDVHICYRNPKDTVDQDQVLHERALVVFNELRSTVRKLSMRGVYERRSGVELSWIRYTEGAKLLFEEGHELGTLASGQNFEIR